MTKNTTYILGIVLFLIIPAQVQSQTKSPDFDGNGNVNFNDFLLFAGAFHSEEPSDLEIYDLSNNGAIDFDDFILFAADFGKTIERLPSDEAQLIAIYISEEIRPPLPLARNIEKHLTEIRVKYEGLDSIITHISFRPPWVPSCIIVGVDTTTDQMIRNGSYHAWDELNKEYQVSEIRLNQFDTPTPYAVLYFDGILHSRLLANFYTNLPGVRYAERNGYLGDFSNVYPRNTATGFSYLFRNGWGDCPSGCTYSKYWYFVIEPTGPRLIGSWNTQEQSAQPSWWNEAQENRNLYRRR